MAGKTTQFSMLQKSQTLQLQRRHPGRQQLAAAAMPRQQRRRQRLACRAAEAEPAVVRLTAHPSQTCFYTLFKFCVWASIWCWTGIAGPRQPRSNSALSGHPPSAFPCGCLAPPQPFPADYNQAVRQAQAATQAALADGARLVEVEFPTASLTAVAGDAEGERVYGGRQLRLSATKCAGRCNKAAAACGKKGCGPGAGGCVGPPSGVHAAGQEAGERTWAAAPSPFHPSLRQHPTHPQVPTR
jgi:hypothetical protein